MKQEVGESDGLSFPISFATKSSDQAASSAANDEHITAAVT
jgi:hypothetical protein